MSDLVMPRLGETVTEGTVIRWLKKEGEPVKQDEMIVEISTDKVDTEIPSPFAGKVEKILVAAGDKVEVGAKLALIGDGERPPVSGAGPAPPSPTVSRPENEAVKPRPLSPIVRKLAKDHQVDLAMVKGTGQDGRISKQDVLAYVAAAEAKTVGPPTAVQAKAPEEREEVVPLGHIRKMIAEHMVRSIQTAAHVTAIVEVDMENVVAVRETQKEAFKAGEGFSLTYLPFVGRAVIESLGRWPRFNAVLDGDNLVIKKYINLGIAVAIPDGLIVPVVKGADGLNITGLARAIHDLAGRARENRLQPDEVHGGTFTITNPGSFGSIIQTPIINQPQVAILSLEAITRRPAVVGSAIAIRHMVNLCLSYDHRANDGAIAAQFLVDIKERLETTDFEVDL